MDGERHKIIVGLDYGTTYSGISFVTSNENSIDKVEVINQWPGTSDTVSKVPTRLAYAAENKNINVNKWGFAVTSSMQSYNWTKLLLDGTTSITELDDPSLKDLFGSGMLKLPPNKSAKEVCTDYLKGLYEYLVSNLKKKFSPEMYEVTPVECWITVPAIWSDFAKDATRSAALIAGFGSRSFDTVNLITEPEAAALAALKPHLSSEALDPILPGEDILVCDCGGGTVDITTYSITETTPRLRFQELCVGVGGKCGSTYIDRNFNKWMTEKFGAAYLAIPQKKRGTGSAFMRSFEAQKKAFGSQSFNKRDQKFIEVEHINMNAPSSNKYDDDEAVVKLTWHEMKSFFDPVIRDIIRLISSQVDLAKSDDHQISRIILVGGFGDSDYLNERIRMWCTQHGNAMKLTCPSQCQAAVVRGAALRGLERLVPDYRKARRHYGQGINFLFRAGIDPESKGYIDAFDEQKYCSGRMHWLISKGERIDSDTTASISISRTERADCKDVQAMMILYSCSTDHAPEYQDHHNVEKIGEIMISFTENDISCAERRYNTTKRDYFMELRFKVKMKLDTDQRALSFQAYVNDRPAGFTTINYTQIEYGSITYRQ